MQAVRTLPDLSYPELTPPANEYENERITILCSLLLDIQCQVGSGSFLFSFPSAFMHTNIYLYPSTKGLMINTFVYDLHALMLYLWAK